MLKSIMPLKGLILLLASLLISLSSSSQKNFLPGYIIQHDGDTVIGFVDYRNWKTCPDNISFRENPDQPGNDFSPSQIKGFSVAGKIYESAVVQVEISPTYNQKLSYDPNFIYRTDTVFLQARYRGAKSLYLLIDNDRKDQFYILDDTSFVLLAYKKYLVETEDRSHTYLKENKKYVGQLTDYLSACPAMRMDIENTGYYTGSVEKLFREYAKCTGAEYEFIRKNGERRTEFGFIAGATMTWCPIEGNMDKYVASVDMDASTNFTFGILFDFFQFSKNRKWSWSNEFIITSFKYKGTLYEYTDTNNYTTSYTTLDGGYAKWHSLARYKFPVGKFFLFADAGPTFGVGGLGTNQVNKERYFYGQMRYEKAKAIDPVKSAEFGLTGGVGIRYKRFTFETRYEFATGFVDNNDLSSSTNRIYLMLGIRL
jgi:hypothetical protein